MRHALSLISAMLGTTLALSAAEAQPLPAQPAPNRCFYINQLQGWRAPDARTIIIRVNMHNYYRLDLSSECALLKSPGSHLITKARGSDTVCSAVDWDLSVSQSPPGAIPEPCIVKAMTLLTPSDVAALPSQFRP